MPRGEACGGARALLSADWLNRQKAQHAYADWSVAHAVAEHSEIEAVAERETPAGGCQRAHFCILEFPNMLTSVNRQAHMAITFRPNH